MKNEEELLIQRKKHPYRIKIKDMSEDLKYNKLNQESKHFQNILKMICYRAEINCANIISEYYKRSEEEKMELVKSIIKSHGDILLNETNERSNNKYLFSIKSKDELCFGKIMRCIERS